MPVSRRTGTALLLLFLLLAISTPAAAVQDDATLSESEIAIRQSHMTLVAFTQETEMGAAITYIYPLYNTDTTRLNSLLVEFKEQESRIIRATTRAEFSNITSRMRAITDEFRTETDLQMTKGYGKPDDLAMQVGKATAGNPHIEEKRLAYWNTRRTSQIRDFDAWVLESQGVLDTLEKEGYDTARAQRTLDVFVSKRPVVVSALESKSDDRIVAANQVTLPLSRELGQQVAEAQGKVSKAERMQFLVDQGNRAVSRADATNLELTKIILDIGAAEPVTRTLKIDLAETGRILKTGNLPLAQTPMTRVKKDLKDLSMAYRDIANTADLPADLTASLRALIITLDTTADEMEDAS